jgi:NAD(P)-dependent dehydrogenase (short-subunit alcohol dehydrogenase family)
MTNDEEQTMAEPDGSFAGKVAFVTGAGSDIGRITALAFAREGANVVVAATDDLTGAGHQALGVLCDVSQEDPVAAMVDRTVATFGRLDMAFNNAGIQAPPTDAANEPAETFDRVNSGSAAVFIRRAATRSQTVHTRIRLIPRRVGIWFADEKPLLPMIHPCAR